MSTFWIHCLILTGLSGSFDDSDNESDITVGGANGGGYSNRSRTGSFVSSIDDDATSVSTAALQVCSF